MDAVTELHNLRTELADLAVWADRRLAGDIDPHYVTEHLIRRLAALAAGAAPRPARLETDRADDD